MPMRHEDADGSARQTPHSFVLSLEAGPTASLSKIPRQLGCPLRVRSVIFERFGPCPLYPG